MTDELTYEAARDELIAIVSRLEAGGLGLEESLALWERGEAVAKICQEQLDGARARLEKASQASSDQDSAHQERDET
jgi:exodeoxyribonuclease VII small subunit